LLASTAALCAALLPLGSLQVALRQRYLPVFIGACSVDVMGLLVALTLAPALAATLRPAGERSRRSPPRSRIRWPRAAGRVRPPWLLAAWGLLLVLSIRGFQRYVVQGEPAGHSRPSRELTAELELPRGGRMPATDSAALRLEAAVLGLPAVAHVVTRVWPQRAEVRVVFRDSGGSSRQGWLARDRLEAAARRIGGARVQVEGRGASVHPAPGRPPAYLIRVGGYSDAGVAKLAEAIGARLRRYPRVGAVDTHASARWDARGPERTVAVRLDPAALERQRVDSRLALAAIGAALEGQQPRAMLSLDGRELPLFISSPRHPPLDVASLAQFRLPARGGGSVPLAAVAAIEVATAVSRIERVDQEYERRVAWEFMGPARLGERVRDEVMRATALPPGYRLRLPDAGKPDASLRPALYRALAAGTVLSLLAAAAVLESLRAPAFLLAGLLAVVPAVLVGFTWSDTAFSRDALAGCLLAAGCIAGTPLILARRLHRARRSPRRPYPDWAAWRPAMLPPALLASGLAPFALWRDMPATALSGALLLPAVSAAAMAVAWAPLVLRACGRHGSARRLPQVRSGRAALIGWDQTQHGRSCESTSAHATVPGSG
jgi:multidrug efflux pump subunit AcrB